MNYIDAYICGYLNFDIKPEFKLHCGDFRIPANSLLKFSALNRDTLEIYRFPHNYRHYPKDEFRYLLATYVGLYGGFFSYFSYRNYKKGNYLRSLLFFIFAFPFLSGVNYIMARVKDVKLIQIKQGRNIYFQTFQDGFKDHEFDLSDLRIINKNLDEYIVWIDVPSFKAGKPQFYIVLQEPKNIYNKFIFEKVILGQNYVKYT